ncbi:MAG: aminotransferase class V-fold PLP-dependent enzyme [Bacteroidota bacterium]
MSNKPSLSARRQFLRQISTSALALPLSGFASNFSNLPALPSLETPDEAYWELVKKQFNVPPNAIMANSANLCPSPLFVVEKVRQYMEDLSRDVSFQNRDKYNKIRETTLKGLANFLEVEANEVGITRNTSESNNILVNGLDLDPGDEVLVWEQNHPTNKLAWHQRAKRDGFAVKEISVPQNPSTAQALVAPFQHAMTANTRLISFSHISNVSGIRMPAQVLCSMAREAGVLSMVDGAQSLGNLKLNLKEIGCDFYTASTHKWLMGPMENGILYVRTNPKLMLWPDSIAAGWDAEKLSVDKKYCVLGQRNDPSTAAISDILTFHEQIGKQHIEDRIQQLSTRLRKALSERIPQIQFTTPEDTSFTGGVLIFNIPGQDFRQIFQTLYEDFHIACAPMEGIRLSPTIVSTLEDMDRLAEAVQQATA